MPLKIPRPTNQLTPSPAAGAGLTPRQLQLLKAIRTFVANRCYSPTIAELASELGISRSTAFEHIAELRKKGLLSAYPGKARSLTLTSKAHELLNCLADHSLSPFPDQPPGIPLVGKVAAGSPIEAVEDTELLSLSSHFASSGDTFALEVTGDSMLDDDIRNGDYVICRRTSVAETGQLVIAIVDEKEATLKRFYKEKTCVRLQPANNDYAPIYSSDCRIEAVVVGLVRKF